MRRVTEVVVGQQIPHGQLREEHLPRAGAQWTKIVPFASSFNAYEELGGFEPAALAANCKAQDLGSCSLTDLRAALFFEYRRYNHFGYDPEPDEMIRLHSLIEAIRGKIKAGEHLGAVEG